MGTANDFVLEWHVFMCLLELTWQPLSFMYKPNWFHGGWAEALWIYWAAIDNLYVDSVKRSV